MERNNQSLNDKLIKASNKVDELKKQTVEKEDLIEILNKTVENKTIEVGNLGQQLSDFTCNLPTVDLKSHLISCDQCEFTTESKAGLKIHMGKKHEEKCDVCDERFAGSTKLKTHICRVHVTNPTYGSLYVKNWYINHECI